MTQRITIFILTISSIFIFSCKSDSKSEEGASVNPKDTLVLMDATNKKFAYNKAYDEALTLWKIPFTEKYIKTSFGNAHIIVSGPEKASPLVLLHGMNASSTMWYPNIKALSEKYRVYAIDFLLEPGKSQCEGEVNSTDEIVKWYYEIFDQLNLQAYSLVGASRGGWLAINIALKSNSQINKIILLSPAQTFKWIKPGPKIISNITYSINPKRKKLRGVLETMTFDVDKLEQLYINQYYIATKEATVNKCFIEMTPFTNKELKSLTMPILVLIGDKDIINSEQSVSKAKNLFPNVETGIISNAGHFLSVDQPEVVNKKMLDFLSDENNVSVKK